MDCSRQKSSFTLRIGAAWIHPWYVHLCTQTEFGTSVPGLDRPCSATIRAAKPEAKATASGCVREGAKLVEMAAERSRWDELRMQIPEAVFDCLICVYASLRSFARLLACLLAYSLASKHVSPLAFDSLDAAKARARR